MHTTAQEVFSDCTASQRFSATGFVLDRLLNSLFLPLAGPTLCAQVFQRRRIWLMMATYSTKQEPLVTCPFNPAHRVKSGRYQIHITKCKKSHPGVDIKHCPFSADHVVEPSQLMHHVFTCPLNTSVKRYHSKPDDSITGPMVPTRKAALGIKSEENWEEAPFP